MNTDVSELRLNADLVVGEQPFPLGVVAVSAPGEGQNQLFVINYL